MTVTSTTAAQSYTGNGIVDAFTFTFKVFSSADLYINKYEIATGTLTLLALTTDYTVSLVDGGDGGGTVTLVAGPLPATHKLIVQRLLSYTQETDYVENDSFPAESTEDAIDKLTMLIQQLKEELDRALLGSITTEAGVIAIGYDSGLPTIAVADADKLVQVNAGGTDYELTTVANVITATVNSLIAINTLTEVTSPVDADIVCIEDSTDGYSRKKVQLSNLGIGADIEIFTADNTWTKPASASVVEVHCVGGGGGGGTGQGSIGGGAAGHGGSGGGGGARTVRLFRATDLSATEAVVIGLGGASDNPGGTTTFGTTKVVAYGGGAGATGAAVSGGSGGGSMGVGQIGVAGDSSVGGSPSYVKGYPGMGGGGGGGISLAIGSVAEYGGAAGGGSRSDGTAYAGGASIHGGGGGGAGGGKHTTDAVQAPGAGGASGGVAGGAAGTSGASPTAGTAGTAGNGSNSGSGGGGGGSKYGGDSAAGGAGGAWGGGGGGGGGGNIAPTVPGAGGAGGKGGCMVISW